MTKTNESEFERLVREGKLDEEKAKRGIIDMWNKGGLERPVKVTATEATDRQSVRGYVTQEKFIKGRTPEEMEKILGLEPGNLKNGATIYRLTETPNADQFTPKGYSQTPGGMPYEPGGKYPPGKGAPQWELKEEIPAEVAGKINYEEPWVEKQGTREENGVRQPAREQPASEMAEQGNQQDDRNSNAETDPGQDEEYYQGQGY